MKDISMEYSEPASLEQLAMQLGSCISRVVLDDDNWRLFGFRRRPKRGQFFNRFISSGRRRVEVAVMRELWAASVCVIASVITRQTDSLGQWDVLLARFLEVAVVGPTRYGTPPEHWLRVFDFDSEDAGCSFIELALRDYRGRLPDELPKVFLQRMSAATGNSGPKLFAGSVMLFGDGSVSVLHKFIAPELMTGRNFLNDIELITPRYHSLAAFWLRKAEA